MSSRPSLSTASWLNQGQSQPFHFTPHIIQNSAPQRLSEVSTDHDNLWQDRNVPSHMVAALLQFNHSLTSMASLPTQLLRLLQKLICLLIPRTISRSMPLAVAFIANFGMTPAALRNLTTIHIAMDILRFDPLTTTPGRTVDTIPCRKLGILLVPSPLEVGVKQPVDMLERDVVRSATLGWHQLRIPDGPPEDFLET
jgi:hypothetical protein